MVSLTHSIIRAAMAVSMCFSWSLSNSKRAAVLNQLGKSEDMIFTVPLHCTEESGFLRQVDPKCRLDQLKKVQNLKIPILRVRRNGSRENISKVLEEDCFCKIFYFFLFAGCNSYVSLYCSIIFAYRYRSLRTRLDTRSEPILMS